MMVVGRIEAVIFMLGKSWYKRLVAIAHTHTHIHTHTQRKTGRGGGTRKDDENIPKRRIYIESRIEMDGKGRQTYIFVVLLYNCNNQSNTNLNNIYCTYYDTEYNSKIMKKTQEKRKMNARLCDRFSFIMFY